MTCERCGGVGLIRELAKDRWISKVCACQAEEQGEIRIRRANLPPGYQAATLENFQAQAHTRQALLLARRYAEEFPPANNRVTDTAAAGLLFTGGVGTGKTHLAAGIAKAIAARGFSPLFVDVRELLQRLRHSYDPGAQETEDGIMAPIFRANLVVIDELGAQRPTEWTFETIELLIGGLYNRMVPTIVTTNLANLPPGGGQANGYERAARAETLGDRIGARMFSRLQQMCRPIEINGPDWRAKR
jgi:DNA replication protein DnaC